MQLQTPGMKTSAVDSTGRHGPFLATIILIALIMSAPVHAQDCNGNGIEDACDVGCGDPGGPCDVSGCGESEDCDANGIPDECDIPTASALFDAGVAYGAGEVPQSVALGDLDRDGDPDLVVANRGTDNVSVLLNNGDGSFAAQVLFAAGDGPISVAVDDLNGDGHLDIAVANRFSDDVTVLINQEDGTFAELPEAAQPVPVAVGARPFSIAIGDFDGDGHRDLVVANQDDSNVSILFNDETGNGTFGPDVTYNVGSAPRRLAVGDLDGDGDLDIATANLDSDDVSILLNNGDGTFPADTTFPSGMGPLALGVGDLDGDGAPDLAVVNRDSNDVTILLNIGDGSFLGGATIPVGVAPASVAVQDLDADGDADLAVANRDTDDVSVLLNNGDGTFAAAVTYGAGDHSEFVATADLDGDTDSDLVVLARDANNVEVLLHVDGDCNGNGLLDQCEIDFAMVDDCNTNGIPDACEPDCNMNGIADGCELATGVLSDVNGNSVPDACEAMYVEQSEDCLGDGSADAPFCTIGEAVSAAMDNDVIIIRPGTYVENVDLGSKSLTLRGVDPENWDIVDATIIDGNRAGAVISARRNINPYASTTFISGLTITGGGNAESGGVDVFNTELTITYCRINDNFGTKAGGLLVQAALAINLLNFTGYDCGLLVDHCHITGNVADNTGGSPPSVAGGVFLNGIQALLTPWTFQNSYVADNTNQNGSGLTAGGVFVAKKNAVFRNTTIKSNNIVDFNTDPLHLTGGGMTLFNNDGAVVEDCKFDGNIPLGLEALHVMAVYDSSFLNNGPIGGCFNASNGVPGVGVIADSFFCGNQGMDYWSNVEIEEINNIIQPVCDCNNNGTDDDTEDVDNGLEPDCNQNNYPDSCEILGLIDCNENGVLDGCDLVDGTSLDEDPADGIPDECQQIAACCINGGCLTEREDICLSLGGRAHGPDVTCDDEPYCGPVITGDFDDDGDVDLVDFGTFQDSFTGPQP